MSIAEAAEMAALGAKMLQQPHCSLPYVAIVPVYVGSSKAPEACGTWITRDPQPRPTFRAIALRRGSNFTLRFFKLKVYCTHKVS